MRNVLIVIAVFGLVGLTLSGCDRDKSAKSGKPKVAYITNGVAPFWDIAIKGAKDAAKELDVELSVVSPTGAADQQQKLEDILVRGVDGIAISPVDADNQTPAINTAAAKTRVITHDSDAPKSNRLMYIGMDNYDAGRMAGELVKEALPNGGKVAIFVGRLGQDNANLRRQGLIDELMDRPKGQRGNDGPSAKLEGKYTIVATYLDQFEMKKAKDNAEDAMVKHRDLAAMVGLFSYNPPACIQALKGGNKKPGEIVLIGFDEQDDTLQAVKDGFCQGTLVQNPYMYGHESVRVLAALAKGDNSVIPASKYKDFPARKIKKNNVDEFWADLKLKTAK